MKSDVLHEIRVVPLESITNTIIRFVRKLHTQFPESCRVRSDLPVEAINAKTNYKTDLLFDGLSCVELEIMVEDEYGLDLDDDIWRSCNTIEDVVNLVARQIQHS